MMHMDHLYQKPFLKVYCCSILNCNYRAKSKPFIAWWTCSLQQQVLRRLEQNEAAYTGFEGISVPKISQKVLSHLRNYQVRGGVHSRSKFCAIVRYLRLLPGLIYRSLAVRRTATKGGLLACSTRYVLIVPAACPEI